MEEEKETEVLDGLIQYFEEKGFTVSAPLTEGAVLSVTTKKGRTFLVTKMTNGYVLTEGKEENVKDDRWRPDPISPDGTINKKGMDEYFMLLWANV